MTMEDTIRSPQLHSLFSDALETVFCYKDFKACTVRENGAIAGYDRVQPGRLRRRYRKGKDIFHR
jgi:hypothetical protein